MPEERCGLLQATLLHLCSITGTDERLPVQACHECQRIAVFPMERLVWRIRAWQGEGENLS